MLGSVTASVALPAVLTTEARRWRLVGAGRGRHEAPKLGAAPSVSDSSDGDVAADAADGVAVLDP